MTTKLPVVPLVAMSFAAFVYVTFEMFAVGLITPMSHDLGVPESQVGLLMTIYAGVVAVVTLPAMYVLRNVDKKIVFLSTVAFLALGTLVQAVASSFAMLVVARIIAAVTHGLFWSLVAPIGARIAPTGHTGQAIGIVSAGSTLALVLGSPTATALGMAFGWRVATTILGVLAIVVFVALLPTLPSLSAVRMKETAGEASISKWALPSLVLYLLLAVSGVFAAYTYLGLIIQETAGKGWVALGLGLFGLAGLVGVTIATRYTDARMIRLTVVIAALFVVGAMLGEVAFNIAGAMTVVVIALAIAVWGTGYGALPTVLSTFFIHAGRKRPEAASSIYVVTYQVGIASGAAVGAAVVNTGMVNTTLWIMTACALVAVLVAWVWTRPLMK